MANETFPNGATLLFEPWPLAKFSIFDCHGVHHGWRRDLDEARAFAAGLPGEPAVVEPPRQRPRSPRALPLPNEAKWLPSEPRADERPVMPHAPQVRLAYELGKSMTRGRSR
jgi:hypothetical protein